MINPRDPDLLNDIQQLRSTLSATQLNFIKFRETFTRKVIGDLSPVDTGTASGIKEMID